MGKLVFDLVKEFFPIFLSLLLSSNKPKEDIPTGECLKNVSSPFYVTVNIFRGTVPG